MQKSVNSPLIPYHLHLRFLDALDAGMQTQRTGTMNTAATKHDLLGQAERKSVLMQLGFLFLLKAHSDDFQRSEWNAGTLEESTNELWLFY